MAEGPLPHCGCSSHLYHRRDGASHYSSIAQSRRSNSVQAKGTVVISFTSEHLSVPHSPETEFAIKWTTFSIYGGKQYNPPLMSGAAHSRSSFLHGLVTTKQGGADTVCGVSETQDLLLTRMHPLRPSPQPQPFSLPCALIPTSKRLVRLNWIE